MPFADVSDRVVVGAIFEEGTQQLVGLHIVAQIAVRGHEFPIHDQGMGDDDVGVLAITEQHASGLEWQVLRGLGGDQGVRRVLEVNSRRGAPHCCVLSSSV